MTATTVVPKPHRPRPIQPSTSRARPSEIDERPRSDDWSRLAEHRGAVVSFLLRRCRDEHQAEDMAHDTLIRASRYVGSLGKVTRPRSWLLQIAVNVQRDVLRKEGRVHLRPPSDELFRRLPGSDPVPGEERECSTVVVDGRSWASDDLAREMRSARAELQVHERAVLDAYYREDGTAEDAARAVGVGRALVKVRLFRARKRLEAEIRKRIRKD